MTDDDLSAVTDRIRTHVEAALEDVEDADCRYHLRQALQLLDAEQRCG